jgi:hypothetical protein
MSISLLSQSIKYGGLTKEPPSKADMFCSIVFGFLARRFYLVNWSLEKESNFLICIELSFQVQIKEV